MPEIDVERYELSAGHGWSQPPHRRDFFKLLGGGILVLLALESGSEAQESGRGGGLRESMPKELGAWLHIGEDGSITVFTGKAEVGQNIRTSLAQAVAEELRTKPETIRLVMADTALTPFDMGTFGSRTTPFMAPQLHKVAASARDMLLSLAAKQWSEDKGSLVLENGAVRSAASGKMASFGELTKGQKLTRTITADTAVTPAAEWKIAGHDLTKINGREIVTGKHEYASDMKRPGCCTARLCGHPPSMPRWPPSIPKRPSSCPG